MTLVSGNIRFMQIYASIVHNSKQKMLQYKRMSSNLAEVHVQLYASLIGQCTPPATFRIKVEI